MTERRTSAVAIMTLALAAAACGPPIRPITVPAPDNPSAAVPDQATIVIVQPTTDVRVVNILDATGRLVGQLNYQSQTAVRIPPGPVRLYATAERQPSFGDRITGTVLAGKVYFATISVRYGGLRFLALKPSSRDDRWSHREQYLRRPAVVMDPARIPEATAALGDAAEMLKGADRFADRLEGAQRDERTIAPEDGL